MNRNVPSHWKMMEFREVAEVVTGSTPSTKQEEYFGGEVPFVTPTELNGGIPVIKTPVTLTELGAKQVRVIPENSVMICCIGSLGKIGIAGTRLATNQQINSLVFDEKIVCHRYGFHYCQTLKPLLTHLAPTTTVPIINKGRFQELKILLPPLPEQKRIAAILDKADSIRRKRQEAVRLTEELLRSVFLDMFGDPVANSRGIKNICLSEVTTRITDGTHLTPKFIDSGVPFIFVKNIKNGKIDFQTDKYISEEEYKKLYERCPVEEGDILYTTVGATYGQAVAVGSFTKFAFQRHVAHVKPDKSKVLSDYLGTIMQLPIVKNQADRWARGAAQPTVNLTELRDFVIPLPPLHLQKEFARRVAAVEKLKKVCRLPLNCADTLFNSLLQRAFNGEL